jgi:hypothetical protein
MPNVRRPNSCRRHVGTPLRIFGRIQGLLHRNTHGRPRALLLPPVKNDLAALQDRQQVFCDPLDLGLLVLRKLRRWTHQQVEHGKLFFGEALRQRTSLLVGQGLAEVQPGCPSDGE